MLHVMMAAALVGFGGGKCNGGGGLFGGKNKGCSSGYNCCGYSNGGGCSSYHGGCSNGGGCSYYNGGCSNGGGWKHKRRGNGCCCNTGYVSYGCSGSYGNYGNYGCSGGVIYAQPTMPAPGGAVVAPVPGPGGQSGVPVQAGPPGGQNPGELRMEVRPGQPPVAPQPRR